MGGCGLSGEMCCGGVGGGPQKGNRNKPVLSPRSVTEALLLGLKAVPVCPSPATMEMEPGMPRAGLAPPTPRPDEAHTAPGGQAAGHHGLPAGHTRFLPGLYSREGACGGTAATHGTG